MQSDREWAIPVSEQERDSVVQAVADWLGEKWLDRRGSSPFQDLWQRRDFMSSNELFNIGWAYKNQLKVANSSWFKDAASKIKTGKSTATTDTVFELMSAAMLNNNSQSAVLADPQQPGYDVLVTCKNQNRIRMSCKVLHESDDEKRFNSGASSMLVGLTQMPWTRPYQIIAVAQVEYNVPNKKLIDATRAIVGNEALGTEWSVDNWTIILNSLSSPHTHARLSRFLPSYNVIIASPYNGNEQKRFEEKFREAAKNLRKHFPSPTSLDSHMIMMKLPESVSIGTATQWLRSKFNENYSAITGVLLYRVTIRSGMDGIQQTFFLNHELQFIENPNAIVRWHSVTNGIDTPKSLGLAVPIGAQHPGDPRLAVIHGGVPITIGSLYVYHRGIVNYELDFPVNPTVEFSQSLQPSLGVEVQISFRDKNTGETGVVQRDPRFTIPRKLKVL